MTFFTPALLLFMPFWATASVLQSVALVDPQPVPDAADAGDDETCPTQWVAMPFTPPSVHAV